MQNSPSLALPYIAPAQAQKHITHNEALRILDTLVQMSVSDKGRSEPPETTQIDQRYLVGENAEGVWEGRDNQIAVLEEGGWSFFAPKDGWTLWVIDSQTVLVFSSGDWIEPSGGVDTDNLGTLGVNTQADAINKLSVKTDSVLMGHDDVTPGSGNIQLTLNKVDANHKASVIYQTNYAGRVEIGTIENDGLSIRVSADGTDWKTALFIDSNTGRITQPLTKPNAPVSNSLLDGGRFAGPEGDIALLAPQFVAPAYLRSSNGSTLTQGPKYTYNSETFGGSRAAIDPEIDALMQRLRSSQTYRRFSSEFYTLKLTAGSGTNVSIDVDGVPHFSALNTRVSPLPSNFSVNFHAIVATGSAALPQRTGSTLFVDGEIETGTYHLTPEMGWKQITRIYDIDTDNHFGYDGAVHRLHATAGSEILIAAPLHIIGELPMLPGKLYGHVPSSYGWN